MLFKVEMSSLPPQQQQDLSRSEEEWGGVVPTTVLSSDVRQTENTSVMQWEPYGFAGFLIKTKHTVEGQLNAF